MGWGSIFHGSRAPAKSDSKSRWKMCRLLLEQRLATPFRKAKITNCSLLFPRARANGCSAPGRESSRNCLSPASDSYVKHQIRQRTDSLRRTSKIKHCPVATFISNSPAETQAIGRQFAVKDVGVGSILALKGELGSGKTLFTKGLVAGLRSDATVTSPTFTIVHEYPGGRLPVYHFDFFRLEDRTSLARLGLADYFFGDGVSVIEWADRFPEFIPEQARWILFEIRSQNQRAITFQGT